MIAVSIVSHGHGEMVVALVVRLLEFPEVSQIIVTRNISEILFFPADDRIVLVDNVFPKGFGANHNAAFRACRQPYFCPVNPDVQFTVNPFPSLLSAIEKSGAALVAPMVKSPSGVIEDSVRYFPTFFSILRKLLGKNDGRYPLVESTEPFSPEWVAGMFMLFRSAAFEDLGGFDEKFFLYYEDVDICTRTWKSGMKILVCPEVNVIHDARRDSHRNLNHLRWHLASMLRYFVKHTGRLPDVF